MKEKRLAILILLAVVLVATAIYDPEVKRRFVHATGRVSLRIDDYLPGAFVEHNLRGVDHLWRAFMAVRFSGGEMYHGKASDSGGEITESNFEYADNMYYAQAGGDTIICVPGVRRIVRSGENHFVPEEDSTFSITVEGTSLTLVSSVISGTYEIFYTEYGALNKITFYRTWIDTVLQPYTQYIYQDTVTGESLYVPPDTLPRDRTNILTLTNYTAYSSEAWKDSVNVPHMIPPDTLPFDLTDWERDTTYHLITQHFWYNEASMLVYAVPPDILPTDSTVELTLLDSTKQVCALLQPDSTYIGAWTQNRFGSFLEGWEIVQTVATDYVESDDTAEGFIDVRLTIRSYTPAPLRSGRFMFFYDADIPSAEPENDIAGMDYGSRVAYIHNQGLSTADVMGFSLYTDDTVAFGAFANWYSYGRTMDTLEYIFENPEFGFDVTESVWTYTDSSILGDSVFYTDSAMTEETRHVDSLYGDVAVYAVMDLPEIAPFDSFVIDLGMIGGTGLFEEFMPSVDVFRDDTIPDLIDEPVTGPPLPDRVTLRPYPNPFNSVVSFDNPGNWAIAVHDISGRAVAYLPAGATSWHPTESQPSGVYLLRPVTRDAKPVRVVLMK